MRVQTITASLRRRLCDGLRQCCIDFFILNLVGVRTLLKFLQNLAAMLPVRLPTRHYQNDIPSRKSA